MKEWKKDTHSGFLILDWGKQVSNELSKFSPFKFNLDIWKYIKNESSTIKSLISLNASSHKNIS